MLLLVLLQLASALEAVVRSEGMADDFATDVMGKEVGRCCCSAEEAEPKYLCADLKNKRLYYPAVKKEPPRKTANLFNAITFTSQIFATSFCEKGKAVARDRFTPAIGKAPAPVDPRDQVAPAIVPGKQDPTPAWAAPATTVMGEAQNIPAEHLDKGMVHTAWRAPLANQEFSKYEFGDLKQYRKYSTWPGMKSETLKAKHIVHNGVIYGPTDEHKEANSVHGESYCSLYEVVAEVAVKKGPVSGSTRGGPTTCTERPICRGYKIGHACGFDHEDTVLLKRQGRKGECLQVDSSLLGGTHCPTGQYHDSVNTYGGTSTWKFCDCRSDASPTGGCSLAESKPKVPKTLDPRVSAPIPGGAGTDRASAPQRASGPMGLESGSPTPAWAQGLEGGRTSGK